jgi:hypothetical protein
LELSVVSANVRKSLSKSDRDADKGEGHRAHMESDTVARVRRR